MAHEKPLKQKIVHLLRRMRLISAAESVYFYYLLARSYRENKAFEALHPDFIHPPLAVMHDAHGNTSFAAYWHVGHDIAEYLAVLIKKYNPEPKTVLEWGCGPARVLRHMPALFPGTAFSGSDYNKATIAWCKAALLNITFFTNELSPPLAFADGSLDVIYAISVLTHLSQAHQQSWLKELKCVVRPGGLIILTTHGVHASDAVLLPQEREHLKRNGVIIRKGVREGKRCYLSYHDPVYVREHLFMGMDVCEHITDNPTRQDVWVLRA